MATTENEAPNLSYSNSASNRKESQVKVVLGAQWGDEGKGKIVDLLSEEVDVVCRCQGGNNAGHTVVVGEKEYDFHLLPSGVGHENCKSLIGNGTVIHLEDLFHEIEKNESKGLRRISKNLLISDRAHIVFDLHKMADANQEEVRGNKSFGTTKKGIGPTYSSKATRNGIRIADLVHENFELFSEKYRNLVAYQTERYKKLNVNVDEDLKKYFKLREKLRDMDMVVDSVLWLNSKITNGSRILIEGANAIMLDIDFGTYPNVTSSNCSIGGVCTGLGIPPQSIGEVYGVIKAYTTRVGTGPFPTEQNNEIGNRLQTEGKEFGVTTGRKRRCGWLDTVQLRYSTMVNGFTHVAITKLDILDGFDKLRVGKSYKRNGKTLKSFPASCDELSEVEVEYVDIEGWKEKTQDVKKFEDLPVNAQKYIYLIEDLVGVKVRWIGVGQSRSSIIIRDCQ
ncbi:DgyrCDS10510 [Dimorphilus gyrociliatus]|uniref:Adenylosuccinate synthetase n=1 Tax=Dimorphilus gyrociliatus TaxID=2664684 RepID=A0A7I8W1J9_9ANNE|nr:DgyrCDS10510 [Dimorphilus gyrociliatus]